MKILNAEKLLADTILNRLTKKTIKQCEYSSPTYAIDDWYFTIKRIGTQGFVQIIKHTIPINFTPEQISKLHQTFFHTSLEKTI